MNKDKRPIGDRLAAHVFHEDRVAEALTKICDVAQAAIEHQNYTADGVKVFIPIDIINEARTLLGLEVLKPEVENL